MKKDYLQSLMMLVLIGGSTCFYAVKKDSEITARYNFRPEIDYKVMEAVRQEQKVESGIFVEQVEHKIVDNRKVVVKGFLESYGSYVDSDYIIDTADRYSVDYKKVVAIAGCETSFWKNLNYKWNAWGYGVWGGLQHGDWDWSTYEKGVESFTREISESKYKNMTIIEMSNAGYNPSQHWKNTCGQFYNKLVELEQ